MPWFDLRVGYTCNNRCRFCDQGDRRARIADAPLSALDAVLRDARASRADGVWLAGGEITLRPDLPALIEAARAAGFGRVGLQTNARILAAPGAADRLRAAGLTDATVALHAATPALHDWLTQAEGSHKQATVGARRLARAGVSTSVATVLTRSGAREIPALAKLPTALGASGHRWIFARAQGAAADGWRTVVPRLALVRDPLRAAIHEAWAERREVETSGVPLCQLGDTRAAAADRLDHPPARHIAPAGLEEPPRRTLYGPPCAGCVLRSVCPGVDAAYAERFGWDEIGGAGAEAGTQVGTGTSAGADPNHRAPPPRSGRAPGTDVAWALRWPGGDPVPGAPGAAGNTVLLSVQAPCPLTCRTCATRDAFGGSWDIEPERRLRQRLVRAAGEGARRLVFAGASPWAHPGLPAVIREARRIGFAEIEVWGPLEPLAGADAGVADKLAGLTRVRAPVLGEDAGGGDAAALAARWLGERVPGCVVERYAPDGASPDLPLYQAAGPASVWASCQGPPTASARGAS